MVNLIPYRAPVTYRMSDYVSFNVNSSVLVRLTPEGEKHYISYLNRYHVDPNRSVNSDADGYVKFQLWDLMKIFGSEMFMGNDLMFKTKILLNKQDIQTTEDIENK